MSAAPFVQPLIDCRDNEVVGGKAMNLAHLIQAGFPVPNGFVVTTRAYRKAKTAAGDMPSEVARAIRASYDQLGSPTVAVRSSATAEDMADASMAGQYETFLDLEGADAVVEAVQKCWHSIDTARTRSYLQEHGIAMEEVAMAVVVQVLVPSEVAGVLFTANPRTGARHEMVIEASWGLGESVVSGIVQPDTLTLDRATARIKDATIQNKKVWIEPGSHAEQEVPLDKQNQCCLNSQHVVDLWALGLKVADHFGSAQDLEWGIHNEQVYLLQSRSITTLEDAENYDALLADVRRRLRTGIAENRGPWVRHNISETLPHPTPLTWSVIKRFMSGSGGFGNMYKTVGFAPSATVERDGFLQSFGGNIYMDLSLAPDMFFEGFPFAYDLDLMRSNPDACQGPPTLPVGGFMAQVQAARKINAVNTIMTGLTEDFDQKLENEIIPEFVAYVNREKQRDLTRLTTPEWLTLWNEREHKVLAEFAPQSLLPSLLGAMGLDALRAFVTEHFWDDDPDDLINLLTTGPKADLTAQANQGLYELAQGERSLDAWLAEYGHRAPEEFDLATPRWRERPEALASMTAHLKDGLSPAAMHKKRADEAKAKIETLMAELPKKLQTEFREHLDLTHRYLHYRENGKYFLMLGYEQLRLMLLEAGRRLELGDDVFLLSWDELHDALTTGLAPLHVLEKRRQTRNAEKRLSLPQVITEADLATLGEPPEVEGRDRIKAFSISSGTCKGPCKIVQSAAEAGDLGTGYVLVCPSTDPSWTPLFVNAAGLVLECGGTLSHGAVVAREMGIPAVVVANATTTLLENEIIGIDGHNGALLRNLNDDDSATAQEISHDDVWIAPDMRPPVAGGMEKTAATIRNVGLLVWGIFLVLTYFVFPPEVLEKPTLLLLDTLLLPLVTSMGKPFVVGLVAFLVASVCIGAQRLLTDNSRLRTAKQRATALQKAAKALPQDSPRAKALRAAAAPVQMRITMAAIVPLAVLLGPMMMSFMWFPSRIDTAARNAKPDSKIIISALIDPDCEKPITLRVPDGFSIDDAQPESQSIINYPAVLKRYLTERQEDPPSLPGRHWAERLAVEKAYSEHLNELNHFLKHGSLPLQRVAWTVIPPKGQAGRWQLYVETDDESLPIAAVLGEGFTPETKELIEVPGRKGKIKQKLVQVNAAKTKEALVQRLEITYLEKLTKGEGTFWKPLDWFESPTDRAATTFEMLFAPWLVLYLIVYVPIMFITKLILRVP